MGIFSVNNHHLFGIVETKCRSAVGAWQGKRRDKDQIELRGEFLQKYGRQVFPNCIFMPWLAAIFGQMPLPK